MTAAHDDSPLSFGSGPKRRNGLSKLLHDTKKASIKSWERCPIRQGMVRRPGLPRLEGRKVMTVTEALSAFWEVRMWTDLRSGVVMARAQTPVPLTARKTKCSTIPVATTRTSVRASCKGYWEWHMSSESVQAGCYGCCSVKAITV